MAFIQKEGIILQNSVSAVESGGRIMLMWTNQEDSEKIKTWLSGQSFTAR